MTYRTLYGTVLLAALLLAIDTPPKEKPTNYEVLSVQVDTVAAGVTRALVSENIRVMTLETGVEEADAFVRQRILETLLKKGFRILTDTSAGCKVRVAVPLIEVNYSEPVASHIFGSPDVIRTIRTDFDVELSDSGRVRYAKTFRLAHIDTVAENEIPGLEVGSYKFLHGRIESGSFFDTIFQPLLFAASAAVIVYLFFTLRGS